jgi:hypothetical protein
MPRRWGAAWAGVGPLVLVAGSIGLTGLAGCSPALDWRQVRPEGWGLAGAWPCRPNSQLRQVALAGPAVAFELMACSADGHNFAMASADMADPARVGPALEALGQAARANIQGQVLSDRPASVPGMTPNAGSRVWQLQGRLPDGQAVREQVLVFAHGLRVFQATVVGPLASERQAKPFFEAIELPR